jgi:D-sedoheptulose 7-phosphate isomerase
MKRTADGISIEDADRVVELLYDAWQKGHQVFVCGNGGSASTATHFTCDLSKTTIVKGKKRFKAHCLNDNIPLMSALINDEGFDNLFYEQLVNHFQEGDVLICISVHGGAGKDEAFDEGFEAGFKAALNSVQTHLNKIHYTDEQ